MSKKNKRKFNRRRNGSRRSSSKIIPRPPSFMSNTVVTRRFRFRYTNATGAVSTYSLSSAKLCALQCIATSTTNLIQIYEAVKIHSVMIWGSPPQNGQTTSVSIAFAGVNLGLQGQDRYIQGNSMGMTEPAFARLAPGKDSQAMQWQSGQVNVGNVLILQVTADGNGTTNQSFILDIILSLRMTNDARTANNNVAVTGPATVGGFYYLGLDNNAGANLSVSSDWKPDGINPTII